jgi:hypothetical protein
MTRRIFISHSTFEDPAGARVAGMSDEEQRAAEEHAKLARDVRDQLAEALRKEKDYAVLLDRDGLKLGDRWRSVLNVWIGGCDAAVLLLSHKALTSSYVAYEASILSHRQDNASRPFLLVPVFIPPVRITDVDSSPLKSTNIRESQAKEPEMATAPEIVAVVLATLKDKVAAEDAPLDRQIGLVTDLLANVGENTLKAAADNLELELEDWASGYPVRHLVAVKLIGSGLAGSDMTLRDFIVGDLPQPPNTALSDLLLLIGSSWVDYRAVERIGAVAAQSRTIYSNAVDPLTARMYVIRASKRRPWKAWAVAEVDAVAGASSDDDLVRVWESAIREALKQVAKTRDAEARLDKWLQTRVDNKEPVFVALPFEGLSDTLLERLKSIPAFAGVTFFLLAGDAEPSGQFVSATGAELLSPDLDRADEHRFCGDYRRIYNLHIGSESDED